MKRKTKIIIAVISCAALLCACVVPTFALAYPNPEGVGSVEYWQPLRFAEFDGADGNPEVSWIIDKYWGNLGGDVTVNYNDFTGTIQETATGSSTKKITLLPSDDFVYDDIDVSLLFDTFTAMYYPDGTVDFKPINDLYILYEDTHSEMWFSIDYDVTFYKLVTFELTDGIECHWMQVTEHISNVFRITPTSHSGNNAQTRCAMHNVINDYLEYSVTSQSITRPLGLDYIPLTFSNLVVNTHPSLDTPDGESEFRGIITTARRMTSASAYTYGRPIMTDIPYENDAIYDEGYSNGYDEGYNVGASDGYTIGFTDGDAEGFDRGYNDGYHVGFDYGYDTGYGQGADIPNDVGEFLSNSIGSFLDTEIFPGITIGGIILIILAIPLAIWFLKMFAGG